VLGAAIGAMMGAVVKVNRTVYSAPIPPDPGSQGRASAGRNQRSAGALAGPAGHLDKIQSKQRYPKPYRVSATPGR